MVYRLGMATAKIGLMVSVTVSLYFAFAFAFANAAGELAAFYNICVQNSEGENLVGWAWSAERTNQAGEVLETISGITGANTCSGGTFEPGTWTFEAGAARPNGPATKVVQGGSVHRWDFIYDSTAVNVLIVQISDQFGNPSPRVNVTVTSSSGFQIPGFTTDGVFTATVKYGEAKVNIDGFPEQTINIGEEPALVDLQRTFPLPGGEWILLDYRGIEAPGLQRYGVRVDPTVFSPLGWACRVYYPGSTDGEVGGCVTEKEEAHLILLEPGLQEIQLVGELDNVVLSITTTIDVLETPALLFQETGRTDERGVEVQFWLDPTKSSATQCSLRVTELQLELNASPCPSDPSTKWSIFLPKGDWLIEVRLDKGTPQEVVFYNWVPVVVKENEEKIHLFMPHLSAP